MNSGVGKGLLLGGGATLGGLGTLYAANELRKVGTNAWRGIREGNNPNPLDQNYNVAEGFDRTMLTPEDQIKLADQYAQDDFARQQTAARDMAMLGRDIGRDLINQQTDADLARQGQMLRSDEAKNLLNQYTGRIAQNQNFLANLASGFRYS